jgi:hypothetical protein
VAGGFEMTVSLRIQASSRPILIKTTLELERDARGDFVILSDKQAR